MFERISNGWELTKQSLRVLSLDKELLLFPVLSGLACLLVLASFALPLWHSDYAQVLNDNRQLPQDPVAYVLLFLFYFASYFVIVFFNAALVACAIIRFNGGNPTLGDGFRASFARLPQIFAWALLSATVGVILRIIESRSEKVGRFVAGLLGMAWSAVTYIVVPVLVVEKAGPAEAIKRSLAVLRRTWGEALVSNAGLGFIMFLAAIVAAIPAILGFLSHDVVGMAVGVSISVILFIVLSLISSAADAIVRAAIYMYAAQDRTPAGFDESLLRSAFVTKR